MLRQLQRARRGTVVARSKSTISRFLCELLQGLTMTARALLATLFSLLFTTLTAAAATHSVDVGGATVLCYHIVESPQDPRMEISREQFHQQMRYLAQTGYNVIPLRHLYEFVAGKRHSLPKNAVVITFDDGWKSTYTEVFPEMQRRRFPFTIFLYPKIIGQTSHALSWKEVKEMSDAGVDVQSHTFSHGWLTKRRHASLDEKAYSDWLQHELVDSKKILERETGQSVAFIAYPYGDYDHVVAASAAKAGYLAGLTCDFGLVRKGSDPLRMRRFAIEKSMDFAMFRRLLGAGSMRVDPVMPAPGQLLDPGQPVITARIPNYKSIDPNSVGIAMLGLATMPFTYDPHDGSITLVLHDALTSLKGKYQRALVWATDAKSGKRVEASLTFRMPEPPAIFAPATTPLANPDDPGVPGSLNGEPASSAPATLVPAAILPTVVTPTPSGSSRIDGDSPKASHLGLRRNQH
jgi:peptidoglycan/xylan/chitin deacetylase (PgdA/CDA1 family)